MEITKKDVEGLLSFLRYGSGDNTVMVNNEYLVAMAELALSSFKEEKEHLEYDL